MPYADLSDDTRTATDRAGVLQTIGRLREELRGAGGDEVERAITAAGLRVMLGDLLTTERITAEEARAELGELAPAVFGRQ